MIGPLEIILLVLIVLVCVGAKWLPALGRAAGKGARSVGHEAKEASASARELVADKVAPSKLGRSAGEGLREARAVRDAAKGKSEPPKNGASAEDPQSAESTSAASGAEKRP